LPTGEFSDVGIPQKGFAKPKTLNAALGDVVFETLNVAGQNSRSFFTLAHQEGLARQRVFHRPQDVG
jgi:hypothetical protein